MSIEIDRQGKMSAALAFERPESAAELGARSGELQAELKAAGFDLSAGALTLSVAASADASPQPAASTAGQTFAGQSGLGQSSSGFGQAGSDASGGQTGGRAGGLGARAFGAAAQLADAGPAAAFSRPSDLRSALDIRI